MTLEKKLPPIIVVAICALLMWVLALLAPQRLAPPTLSVPLALLCFFTGFLLVVLAVREMKSANTTLDPTKPEESAVLVRSGIFKASRNPIYLGFALMLLAWGLYLSSLWSLLGVLVFTVYLDRFQIRPEERELNTLFGDEYQAYQAKVRRWL